MAGINRFAGGLLAFLDLKSRGTIPNELDLRVQPSLDMVPHYENGRGWQWTAVVGAPVAGSYTQAVQVPAGETWLVRLASLRGQITSAGTASYALCAGPANSLGQASMVAQTSSDFGPGQVGQMYQAVWQPTYPILVNAGFFFNCLCTQFSGTHQVTVSVLYSKYSS